MTPTLQTVFAQVDADDVLGLFDYEHLPTPLQHISRPFHQLATTLLLDTPPGLMRTLALLKLLEAKDCAVRAALAPPVPA